jgi:hypothetical protein
MATPSVKIALSVELTGEWVTPALIAELATELSVTAARKLAEAAGEPVEPGPITVGIRADRPPAEAGQ